jgi:hypothetical protein
MSGKQASQQTDSSAIWLVQVIATDLESMEATQRLVGGDEVGFPADLVLFAAGDGPADAEGKTSADAYAITVRKLSEDEITDILDHEAMGDAHAKLSAELDAEEKALAGNA